MARPTKNDIDAGIQNWDGKIDDNDEVLLNAPIPIHEHVGDQTDLEATFAAAAYDRCMVWVNHTSIGWTLCYSDGTNWMTFGNEHRPPRSISATTTQAPADEFVLVSGTGTIDYDLLAVASWQGRTVTVRNDMSSGTLNLDPNGSEVINALAGGAPYVLAIGSTATVYNDGSQLYVSVAL